MRTLSLIILAASLMMPARAQAAGSQEATSLARANAAVTENKPDVALALYEQVFAESKKLDDWFNAQKGIAVALAKKGALPEALKAVRLCLDGAPTLSQFDEAAKLAANLLSAADNDVQRANAFLEFQKSGTGTNPMEQIPYPVNPGREKLFAGIRAEAGDTPAASRMRAWTFLYSGKPREAAGQYADAFRRASAPADLQTAAADLVTMALRAVRGQGSDIENEIEFVVSGPAGPDGQPGTPDDLKDPFAGFPAPPPRGQGGLSGDSPAELDALRKIQDAAVLYAGDPRMRPEVRRDALNAMQRANDASDNWGASGQKVWYLQLALSPEGAGSEEVLLIGAQAAAKGRALNLGGAVALWKQIADQATTSGLPPTKGIDRARKQFDSLCTILRKNHPRKPGFKPLARPATF
jgi:hypothetical protein